jgi:putative oxidoreductase
MDKPTTTSAFWDDLGKLILRLAVGGMMLLHGIGKIKGGVGGIGDMLAAKGLPELMAYGAYVGEVLAPVLIIVGFFTRPAALLLVINMVTAIVLAHSADILKLDPQSGGWVIELQMFYLLGALALMFLGAGRFSLSGGRGKLD